MDKPVFEVGHTYRTRGGGTARVICVDAKGDHKPIVALHSHEDGSESLWQHAASGLVHSVNNRYDLLPPDPPKPVGVRIWFNVYNCYLGGTYWTKQKAMSASGRDALGTCETVLALPSDIAAQCDWLKDAEIVHDD